MHGSQMLHFGDLPAVLLRCWDTWPVLMLQEAAVLTRDSLMSGTHHTPRIGVSYDSVSINLNPRNTSPAKHKHIPTRALLEGGEEARGGHAPDRNCPSVTLFGKRVFAEGIPLQI